MDHAVERHCPFRSALVRIADLGNGLTPIGAALTLVGMWTALTHWADYDVFWHLANGRLMADGVSPRTDQFSWSAAGEPYTGYSLPLDRLFYAAWQIAGPHGLAVLSAIAIGAVILPIAVMVGRLRLRPIVEAGLLLLLLVAISPLAGARPHVIAGALCVGVTILLARPLDRRRALVAGGLLGAWALIHGSFVIGFLLLAAAGASWLLTRQREAVLWTSVALVLGFAISLLSPYRLDLWTAPVTTATNPLLPVINTDWFSLRPSIPQHMAMVGLLLAAVAIGIWRVGDARVLGAVGVALVTLQVARFGLFAAPLLTVLIAQQLVTRWPAVVRPSIPSPRLGRVSWAVMAVGSFILLAGPVAPATAEDASYLSFPTAAVDRLLACGEPAPVWNSYSWGGYLIWRGDGRWPVGIDGRMETLYADDVLLDYLAVQGRREDWQTILRDSPTQYALVPRSVADRIDALTDWETTASDDVAVVVVREGSPWHCAE